MNISTFRLHAIESAKMYYQYLDENGRGVSVVNVRKIVVRDHYASLYLKSRLPDFAAASLDSLMLVISGYKCSATEVAFRSYNRSELILSIKPNSHLRELLLRTPSEHISIVSDLKFLVRRVQGWYQAHGLDISIPSEPFNIPEIDDLPGEDAPSDEQLAAIKGALSSPLSYIWGAPGTGKTRFVLANCVSLLHRIGDKILLLAPTNNALEQMLFGVLPILQRNGVSLDRVLRLGLPGAQFSEKYPMVCEQIGVEKKLAQITNQISDIEALQHFRLMQRQWNENEAALYHLLDILQQAQRERYLSDRSYSASVGLRAEYDVLSHETEASRVAFQKLKSRLDSTGSIIKFLRQRWYDQKTIELDKMSAQLKEASRRLGKLSQQIGAYDRERRSHDTECSTLFNQAHKDSSKLHNLVSSFPALQEALETPLDDLDSAEETLRLCLLDSQEYLDKSEPDLPSLANLTDEQISALLDTLHSEEHSLSSSSTEERMDRCDILAATLDRYLTLSFDNGFSPSHIFLDEAGYCSLIKGMTVLALGVPTTFLGDHKQLPPICEMDDRNFRNDGVAPVCLWAQSVIHLEDALFCDMGAVRDKYLTDECATFQIIKKFELNCTYRFGRKLASVLAAHVYSPSFHSAVSGETNLFVIDAPSSERDGSRSSSSECNAIQQYILDNNPENFCVLTPYHKQVSLLSRSMPALRRGGLVSTIHAAQGREWDTVIFSVVDTNDMWFTNSRNRVSKGLSVINTAISRARKNLVVVCDYAFWSQHSEQLIGQLVLNGTEIPS